MGDEPVPGPRGHRRSRKWVFTLHRGGGDNPVYEETFRGWGDTIAELFRHAGLCFAFQLERGEQGRLHYQGYVEFPNAVSMRRVVRGFANYMRPHVDIARGTRKQNLDYCTKDPREGGPWVEPGPDDPWWLEGGQGKRTDLKIVAEMVAEGKTDAEIVSAYPGTFVKNWRGLARLREVLQEAAALPIRHFNAYWITGPPGCGKSHAAAVHFPTAFRRSAMHGHWFDGYEAQEVMVYDDFDWTTTDFPILLEIGDKYKGKLPIKGGFKENMLKCTIIISNQTMQEVYPLIVDNSRRDALTRRFLERRVKTREECEQVMEEIKAFVNQV